MPLELVGVGRRLGLSDSAVAEAAAVLRDPLLPGEPWSDEAIADALEDLVVLAGGGSLAVPATTLRWLVAIDAGQVPG